MTKPSATVTTTRISLLGLFGFLISCGLITLACGADEDGGSATPNPSSPETGTGSTSGSSGFSSSGEPTPQPDTGPPPACVSSQAQAIEGKRPVDIIVAIDNSDSMAAEISEVENQINVNFANIIEASGLDYRIILLSNHGAHAENFDASDPLQRICIKAPLSGTTCAPIPPKPVETAKFVHHNVVVNSTDAWCQILQTFNAPDNDGSHPMGWAKFLRASAFKTFVVITDDRVNTSCNPFGAPQPLQFDDKDDDIVSGTNVAGSFDSALFALSPAQFGNVNRRNYVWHSIIGVAPFDANDLTKPYPPSAPVNIAKCGATSVAPATGHQALSKLTGGLRYPTCGLNYTTIFQAMADNVIKSSTLACEYAVPANPDGGTIDPATAVVRYTSGAKPPADFGQVNNLAACAPDKFYIDGGRIHLCPDACSKVQLDEQADVKILFGCKPKPGPGTN